jgi:hypothetical protein
MSKLLENKQMVHIASEVVVLIGLTFYFSQKNKKLMGHIEDFALRLEEQDDIIQKHEQLIQRLANAVQQLQQNQVTVSPVNSPVKRERSRVAPVQSRRPTKPVHSAPPLKNPSPPKPVTPKIHFDSKIYQEPEHVYDSRSDSEEDLDKELLEELGDLQDECIEDIEDDASDTSDLKKEN